MRTGVVTALLLYCAVTGSVRVPPPENVRINSHNMGLLLEWDPPYNSSGANHTFTAQCNGWSHYTPTCSGSSALSCDFTPNLTCFGTYSLRVRTEMDGQSSEWVEIKDVNLMQSTEIGAPKVKLFSRKGLLEVDIADPTLRKADLNQCFTDVSYTILYWAEGTNSEVVLKNTQKRVVLPDLTPEVRYCVQVHITLDRDKISQPSNTSCETITSSDEVETWLILVVLLISFVVVLLTVLLLFLVVWYTCRGIRFLQPRANVPEHFKEFLSGCHEHFTMPLMDSGPPVEHYHVVSIIRPDHELRDDTTCSQNALDMREEQTEHNRDQIHSQPTETHTNNTENQQLLH